MNQSAKISQVSVQAVVLICGIFYTFIGLALLFNPTWFFNVIGNFPPFNRHYMGDVGSFTLPIGIGLIIASANPMRHIGLIGAVLAANLLHTGNHAYDAIIGQESIAHWLKDVVPLAVFAVVFWWAAWRANKKERIQ